MMEQGSRYLDCKVSLDEKIARIVLSPRDIDPLTNYPKDSFITLRNQEDGISFLRFDYMGEDAFRQSGEDRANLYNLKLKKAKYVFVGWMEAIVSDILAIAPEKLCVTVNNPEANPNHVNICFKNNGEIVKGIVTDAEILDLMDELFHCLRYVQI